MRCLIVLSVLASAILAGCRSHDDLGCSGFDLKAWRHDDDHDRTGEARALADCDALIDKSEAKVRRLLGPTLASQAFPFARLRRGSGTLEWFVKRDDFGEV